jgi:hypothetical protein
MIGRALLAEDSAASALVHRQLAAADCGHRAFDQSTRSDVVKSTLLGHRFDDV